MNANKKRKIDSNELDDSSKRHKMAPAEPSILTQVSQAGKPQANDEGGSSEPPVSGARKAVGNNKGKKKKQDATGSGVQQPRKRINKLDPPRPFPVVPTSVSDTGPRSSHREGKNMICLTRKTSLGTYMRRCKNVILKDGSVLFVPFPFIWLISS